MGKEQSYYSNPNTWGGYPTIQEVLDEVAGSKIHTSEYWGQMPDDKMPYEERLVLSEKLGTPELPEIFADFDAVYPFIPEANPAVEYLRETVVNHQDWDFANRTGSESLKETLYQAGAQYTEVKRTMQLLGRELPIFDPNGPTYDHKKLDLLEGGWE